MYWAKPPTRLPAIATSGAGQKARAADTAAGELPDNTMGGHPGGGIPLHPMRDARIVHPDRSELQDRFRGCIYARVRAITTAQRSTRPSPTRRGLACREAPCCLEQGCSRATDVHVTLLLDSTDNFRTAADFMLRGSDGRSRLCADACQQMFSRTRDRT
jgi:hypothetical protein